jgi:hypothetical protein
VPVGRADDFAWPRRSVLPLGADPVVATSTIPLTPMQPYETRHASATPAAAPTAAAPRPAGPAPVRPAATAPAAPQRQTSIFGSWQQQPQQQQQQAQRRIEPARQPFFFPFFGGR